MAPTSRWGATARAPSRNCELWGTELDFETLALDEKLIEDGAPISSTRCRGLIERGDIERAPAFLGRPYRMSGRVVSGQQLGRTIGVPTINVEPHPRKCVPAHGVYAVRAHWDGQSYPAALNIGVRPTVDGTRRQIEFHVLNQKHPDPATICRNRIRGVPARRAPLR